MAKKKTSVPKDETKSDRFQRVVTPRVRKALKSIAVVGYCASSSYEYTPKNIADICTALRQAVDNVEKKYTQTGTTGVAFDL